MQLPLWGSWGQQAGLLAGWKMVNPWYVLFLLPSVENLLESFSLLDVEAAHVLRHICWSEEEARRNNPVHSILPSFVLFFQSSSSFSLRLCLHTPNFMNVCASGDFLWVPCSSGVASEISREPVSFSSKAPPACSVSTPDQPMFSYWVPASLQPQLIWTLMVSDYFSVQLITASFILI